MCVCRYVASSYKDIEVYTVGSSGSSDLSVCVLLLALDQSGEQVQSYCSHWDERSKQSLTLCLHHHADSDFGRPEPHLSLSLSLSLSLTNSPPLSLSLSLQVLEGEEHSKVSRINLIDLAGSERSSVAMTSGDRLKVAIIDQYVTVQAA